MAKYYLIEKYTAYDNSSFRGESYTKYDVREYSTPEQLQDAILKGSQHGGSMMPAKGLEIRLQLFDEPDDMLEGKFGSDRRQS